MRCWLLLILWAWTTPSTAMSLFDLGQVYPFSAVQGQLTWQGQPVAHATVQRSYQLGNQTHSDTTKSDALGRFNFPEIRTRFLGALLPTEPVIPQRIQVHYRGQDWLLWKTNKRNYRQQGELGQEIQLHCELEAEVDFREYQGLVVEGLCQFKTPDAAP